ncbi:unnamed protein product [Phaedon cochleariae]|uniref:Uncharacterized protein n=1 Tax=Phaedon cochleariae TaxID=80249 RepID=A0A9P0DJV9_PHACE|nr:unnamed protein product [Phaedon cochleariae]
MSNTALSENEDDPEVYESSGDEWDSVEEKKPNRRSSKRLSKRLSKKPRKTVVETTSSEEEASDAESPSDDSDDEPRKRKSNNGVNRKKVVQKSSKKDKDEEDEGTSDAKSSPKEKTNKTSNSDNKTTASVPISKGIHRKFIPKTIYSEDYATGSFVILKKDAQAGDPAKHPSIWRIDGKALLQKYEAFDDDSKVRHKNTSIYTGWSPMDKDLYAPVTVDVIHHNNQNLTVELHWDKLKEINIDSD